jgi:hypothetical protein
VLSLSTHRRIFPVDSCVGLPKSILILYAFYLGDMTNVNDSFAFGLVDVKVGILSGLQRWQVGREDVSKDSLERIRRRW